MRLWRNSYVLRHRYRKPIDNISNLRQGRSLVNRKDYLLPGEVIPMGFAK